MIYKLENSKAASFMGSQLSLGPHLRDGLDTCLSELGPNKYCIKYPIKIIIYPENFEGKQKILNRIYKASANDNDTH